MRDDVIGARRFLLRIQFHESGNGFAEYFIRHTNHRNVGDAFDFFTDAGVKLETASGASVSLGKFLRKFLKETVLLPEGKFQIQMKALATGQTISVAKVG